MDARVDINSRAAVHDHTPGAVVKRRSPETIAMETLGISVIRWVGLDGTTPVGLRGKEFYLDDEDLPRVLAAIAAAIRADRKQRKGAKGR